MGTNLKNKKRIFTSGFTLVETIIYIAIFSLFVFSITSFLNIMTNTRLNNQIVLEINNQGNGAIRTITQYIRNSTSFSINGSTLNLTTPNGSVIFSNDNGVLNINEGSGLVALTNNAVTVTNLTFADLSQGQAKNIKINLTLNNTSNINNINRSADVHGSASLRS